MCRDKVASATGCRGTEPSIRVGACVPDCDWSRVGIGESTRARRRRRVTRARSCAFARVGARSHHVRLVSRARARWVRARRARTRVIRDRKGWWCTRCGARECARAFDARARARIAPRRARARASVFFSRRLRAHRCRAPSSRPRSRIARRAKNAPVESRASRDAL